MHTIIFSRTNQRQELSFDVRVLEIMKQLLAQQKQTALAILCHISSVVDEKIKWAYYLTFTENKIFHSKMFNVSQFFCQ